MRVAGGVLKEAVDSYAKIIPNSQVEGAKTDKRRRAIFAVATRR
jgi:hypothetical protein